MKHNKGKKSVTVGVQELSPTEIKKREATYRKDLTDVASGIQKVMVVGERFKKDGILKLAKDLVEAGTIEKYKISIRIKSDLKDLIDKGFLTAHYIVDVLPDEYVRPYNTSTGKGNTSLSGSQPTETTTSSRASEGQTQTSGEQEQLSEKQKEIQKHEALAQDILGYLMAVVQKITGYDINQVLEFGKDYRTLSSETKQYRFELSKKLSDLNLKSVYDDSRRLLTVLNDFIDQLDKELDSRKNKEALTSE